MTGLNIELLLTEVNTFQSTSPVFFAGIFLATILLGMELLNVIVYGLFSRFDKIPVKGKHLDKLEFVDNSFIMINKFVTGL